MGPIRPEEQNTDNAVIAALAGTPMSEGGHDHGWPEAREPQRPGRHRSHLTWWQIDCPGTKDYTTFLLLLAYLIREPKVSHGLISGSGGHRSPLRCNETTQQGECRGEL